MNLSLAQLDSGLYRKEIAYVGDFVDANGRAFSIRAEGGGDYSLRNWLNQFALFRARGIEVPIPAEHNTHSDARRGTVVAMELSRDSKGREALFATCKFASRDVAEKNLLNQVSIFSPGRYVDSTGAYDKPITHVALTSYPVLPGLDKFLALSFGEQMRELAKKLGIADEIPDAELPAKIAEAIDELLATVAASKEPPAPEKSKEPPAPEIPEQLAASLRPIIRDNRAQKIATLVREGKITSAVATKLSAQYVSDNALSLSLTNGNADGFDSLIVALSDNQSVVKFGEQTGAQTDLAMSQVLDKTHNPLLADAHARRAAANAA